LIVRLPVAGKDWVLHSIWTYFQAMLASLFRGARLVKHSTVPALCLGAGYTTCWAQGQEETVPQLLACAAAASWAGLTRGFRRIGESLPDSAVWPRQQIAKVETLELRVLSDLVAQCSERGLDSAPLRRVALGRLCNRAEADLQGDAVSGLAPKADSDTFEKELVKRESLATLSALIDQSAAALTCLGGVAGREESLVPIAAALQAIVTNGAPGAWHKDLGSCGTLHVARAAAIASSWLASSLQPAAVGSSDRLSPEDEQEVIRNLQVVWQALQQPSALAAMHSASKATRDSEVIELYHSLEAKLAFLECTPAAPPQIQAPKDYLPSKLRASIAASHPSRIKANQPQAAAAVVESVCEPAATGTLGKFLRLMEWTAWAAIIGGTALAVSQDGMGLMRFHVVPTQWRPHLRSLLQERAVRIEELMAKYEPPPQPGSMSDSIVLGPWGAQSTYIQAPAPPRE